MVTVRDLGHDKTQAFPALHAAGYPRSWVLTLPNSLLNCHLAIYWSGCRVCSDSTCEELLHRAKGFAHAVGLVEARDRAQERGRTGTQTASVGLRGGRTVARAHTIVCK